VIIKYFVAVKLAVVGFQGSMATLVVPLQLFRDQLRPSTSSLRNDFDIEWDGPSFNDTGVAEMDWRAVLSGEPDGELPEYRLRD
jgi:hypothetical protein